MKEQWLKLSARMDAMTLRERIAIFAAVVAVVLYLVNALALEPLFARNKALETQIKQQNIQIDTANADIDARMAAFEANPDVATLNQLAELNRQSAALAGSLRTMQRGLVAPEKMSQLLQQLLRSNGKLKLVSMRTLPVSGLGGAEAVQATAGAAKDAPKPRDLLYRHGVEVVLQGSYLDMLDYMESMEALPSQLFWGRVQLDGRSYPNATLTLTLYTLGLDEKWMTL